MGQEFFINSQQLQDKVSSLLPSQGGAGAGFDLSASTQIIPIIDLTESAEGSNLREDLQTSFSHASMTPFSVTNTTTTIVVNTGYFRVYGNLSQSTSSSTTITAQFNISDGTTTKIIQKFIFSNSSPSEIAIVPFDFVVFLSAGDSLVAITDSAGLIFNGVTRQIATIDGVLVNPN